LHFVNNLIKFFNNNRLKIRLADKAVAAASDYYPLPGDAEVNSKDKASGVKY